MLISLDTTRADALSCYGQPPVPYHDATPLQPRTPVLDALAARGLRFQRFYAQSPSTLASHATMFTGADPHQTGVVRNGFPLGPALPTLAERLRDEGWATRAVIGAAALESGLGVDRGFQVYDDESPSLRGLMYQTPAPEVVERALATVGTEPLFLFVHFFDAHAPYEPPSPFAERFRPPGYHGRYLDPEAKVRTLVGQPPSVDHQVVDGRYLGEIAALDAQIGKLLAGLEARGVLDDALIVVLGDHGEALSDDPSYAWSHGNDVSDGVMKVPLLMEARGSVVLRRGVVQSTAAMQQVAPTLELLLGLEPTLGAPLDHLVRPGPVRDEDGWPARPTSVVLMEATRPRDEESDTAWNNLPLRRRAVVGPLHTQAYPYMGLEASGPLVSLLEAWDARAPSHRSEAMPDHLKRALEALGYLE